MILRLREFRGISRDVCRTGHGCATDRHNPAGVDGGRCAFKGRGDCATPRPLAPPPLSLRARGTRRRRQQEEEKSVFRFHRHHAPSGVRGGRRHDQGTAALPLCARGDAARARPASAAPPGCSLSALRGGAAGAACPLPGAAEAPHGRRWHLRSAPVEPWGSDPGGSGSAQSSASLGVWGRRTPAKVNVVLHRAGRYSCPAACTASLCARSRWPRARPGAQGPCRVSPGAFLFLALGL